jgi:hypothetical protein
MRVTWNGNNLGLNLYQQLLAALQNLDGDPLGGPPAVDAAIAAELAGIGGSGLNVAISLNQAEKSDLVDVLSDFNKGKFAGFPHCK